MNKEFINEVICGDCEILVSELEDNSIDLVVTSPPYNVDLGNNKYHKDPYDLYNDNKDHQDYIEWLKSIFGNIKEKLVTGGRVVINIGDNSESISINLFSDWSSPTKDSIEKSISAHFLSFFGLINTPQLRFNDTYDSRFR